MGSVQMPGPWGLAQFLELKESRWVEGDQFPPNQAQARLDPGVLVAVAAPADCSPHPTPIPQEGRQHQGLAPPGGGKTTLQVIRFKLKIIKITYKIKKDNPCPNKPMTRLPGPLDTLAGEGGGTGGQPTRVTAGDTSRARMGGPASTVSSSSLQRTAIGGRQGGREGLPRAGV